jgi:AcrR family transcriptional regulator
MPRVRASDYDAKSQSILDSAAALFAKVGYPNAKMQDVATACGATKSMLYHYFPTKDDLLYAMLEDHLEKLIAAMDEVSTSKGTTKERFDAFLQIYVQKSNQSRRRHVIAMNDIKFLPKDMQQPLIELERRVTNQVTDMLREIHPGLGAKLYKPYGMLLLGMLNWTDFWYKTNGEMKPQELCDRISRLFLKGFLAEKPARGAP